KSTLAAEIFSKLKQQGKNAELVREYAKEWAWQQRKIKPIFQLHLLGEQSWRESQLYGNVEYIVTDSPLLLSPFYEQHYGDSRVTHSAAFEFMKAAENEGVEYEHFFIVRHKPYMQAGRFETEAQARDVDVQLQQFLRDNSIPYSLIAVSDELKATTIIDTIL
ncbi:MAG TPA: AAA family ATPase, partial [Blastocatellia bacterium]|nr:AAA family ATPase [Blastocatellia bacterium]